MTIAASTSSPLPPSRSAIASDAAVNGVPACTMLRRSLSSDAAASLSIAFTRAAWLTGSFSPISNQMDESGRPPCSRARSRTIWADSIVVPKAALAKVLAITIAA